MLTTLSANLDALARRFGRAPNLPLDAGDSASAAAPNVSQAIAEATAWLGAVLPSTPPAIVIGLGLGAGYAIEALHARAPGTRIVVVEPEPTAARRLLERRSWVDLIERGRLAVLVGPDYATAAAVAKDVAGLAHAPVITDPLYARDRAGEVAAGREALSRLIFQGDANDAARRAFAPRYVMHTLANTPRIAREGNAERLTNAFAGVPAVIAAAGPSLDRNLHELAPVMDRALLIACDTAAWPLLSGGAPPHVIVAVDASEANARHLVSYPAGRSVLVAEGSVHPSALVAFENRAFFFRVADHEPWPWLRSIGLDRPVLDAWGSVATTAFSLALNMGCNPIIFIGADFAFTGGRPYCRGTSLEPIWASWVAGGQTYDAVWQYLIDRWPVQTARDTTGADVRTSGHLVAFRDWIAERAAARPDRVIVNATGGGLLAGPAIRQQQAGEALAGTSRLDPDQLRRHLRGLHAPPEHDLSIAFASAATVLSGQDGALLDRWGAFTGGAVPREALRTALASAEYRAWEIGSGLRAQLARSAS